MAILPFLAMYFMVLKGFIYTNAVYFYAFASHLVAFSLAFSTKTACI